MNPLIPPPATLMRTGGRLVALAAAMAMLPAAVACRRSNASTSDLLPGHSRPMMAHDWPHPRDFRFQESTFKAPDPGSIASTSSGVRVVVLPSADETVARVTLAAPLGRLHERGGEAGASALVARMLADPTTTAAGMAASVQLAAIGAQIRVQQSLDVTTASVEALTEDWETAARTLLGLARRLEPDASLLARYRTGPGYAGILAGVDGDGFRPAVELERLVGGYPLAPPDPGVAVSRSALQAVLSRSLGADVVVVALAGNIARDRAVAVVEEMTRNWPKATERPSRAAVTARTPSGSFHTVDAASLEGWIAIGRYVEPVPADQQAALAVMADVLGTRLNIAAREIRGLANRANFVLPHDSDVGGLLHVRTGGRVEAVAPLVKVSLDEIVRLRSPGDTITVEEIDRSRGAVVLGRWQAMLDGVRPAGSVYAEELVRHDSLDALLGWPKAVQAVTAAQVKDAATRYLDPAALVTVVVGPLEQIRAARHPRWPASLDELAGTH